MKRENNKAPYGIRTRGPRMTSISQTGQLCLKRSYTLDIELVDGKVVHHYFTCYNSEYALWLLNEVEENTLRRHL